MDNDMRVDPSSGFLGHNMSGEKRFRRRAPKHKAVIIRLPNRDRAPDATDEADETDAARRPTGRHLDIVV